MLLLNLREFYQNHQTETAYITLKNLTYELKETPPEETFKHGEIYAKFTQPAAVEIYLEKNVEKTYRQLGENYIPQYLNDLEALLELLQLAEEVKWQGESTPDEAQRNLRKFQKELKNYFLTKHNPF